MRTDLRGRRAVIYSRVSSDEQARHGYSLGAQDEALRAFCAHAGIVVVGSYRDEGHSGKSFARPAYQQLVGEVRAGQTDYLLVTKWSRFARNVDDARTEIRRWGERGAEVQAVEQWINYADPNHLYQLLINLVEPDVANRWLSINVRQGMRRAMLEGRWVSAPPVGYVRVRDGSDRATLALCPVQAPLVAAAFVLASDAALPVDEVYRRAKANGLRVGRSRFFDMLRQPAYVGRITVAATETDPAQSVPAQHEAIVDPQTWGRVQARLDNPRRRGERGPDDRYPLRGVLLCPTCRLPQSVTHNTGRSLVYAYYTCHRCGRSEAKGGRGEAHRVRVEAAHAAAGKTFGALSLPAGVAAVWREIVREQAADTAVASRRRAVDVRRRIAEEDERRARAEDLYIDGRLSPDALARATVRADERLVALRGDLAAAEAEADTEGSAALAFALTLASDFGGLWARGDAEARRVLAGSVWPSGATFDQEGVAFRGDSPLIDLFDVLRAENDGRPPRDGDGRPVRYAREDSNL